jgi:hypothetical protein
MQKDGGSVRLLEWRRLTDDGRHASNTAGLAQTDTNRRGKCLTVSRGWMKRDIHTQCGTNECLPILSGLNRCVSTLDIDLNFYRMRTRFSLDYLLSNIVN